VFAQRYLKNVTYKHLVWQ